MKRKKKWQMYVSIDNIENNTVMIIILEMCKLWEKMISNKIIINNQYLLILKYCIENINNNEELIWI